MKNPHNQGALCAVVCAESQRHPQRGAALLEYALVVALVGVVGISGVRGLGEALDSKFTRINASLEPASATICDPDDICPW
jgi:Flp pilus assembly pilin Flp